MCDMCGIIKCFIREGIYEIRYWIVWLTPSQGIHEHGLMQCTLLLRGHELEGTTKKDAYALAQNIFDLEYETRPIERHRF